MNDPFLHTTPLSLQAELRIDACLGEGGMSRVWAATTPAGTPVAVKVSKPTAADPAAARALIRREFAFLDSLSHPNIVSVLGLIEMDDARTGGGLGLVMEYVGGGDLVSLAGSGPEKWVPVAAQLAGALRYMHAAGIVHRDIKARNVLLRPKDEACLIDFSLAAELAGLAPRGGGTIAYQSVNQRSGGPPEIGDDVFAFAVLIYELWTGALPFGPHPSLETLERPGEAPGMPKFNGLRALDGLAELVCGTLGWHGRRRQEGIEPFADALELALRD